MSVKRRKVKNIERNCVGIEFMMHVGSIYTDFIKLLHKLTAVLWKTAYFMWKIFTINKIEVNDLQAFF